MCYFMYVCFVILCLFVVLTANKILIDWFIHYVFSIKLFREVVSVNLQSLLHQTSLNTFYAEPAQCTLTVSLCRFILSLVVFLCLALLYNKRSLCKQYTWSCLFSSKLSMLISQAYLTQDAVHKFVHPGPRDISTPAVLMRKLESVPAAHTWQGERGEI